jgi:hypothetical protein
MVDSNASPKRILEPFDRISEVVFGLIMVLAFTGSLSVADATKDDVHAMLAGALGCNLVWGLIDAVLYLMGSLAEKGTGLRAWHAMRAAKDPAHAHRVIADAMPPLIASVLDAPQLESIREGLMKLPPPPKHARLSREDLLGSAGVMLLVFLSTFPVTMPFIFMTEVGPALRVSNAIAIALLFFTGYAFGRVTGRRPWVFGISMVALGLGLVTLTIAFGG